MLNIYHVRAILVRCTPLTAQDKTRLTRAVSDVRKKYKVTTNNSEGFCAVVCCDLYMNKMAPGYYPYSVMVGEDEHVILVNADKEIIDPTGDQFRFPLFSWLPGMKQSYRRPIKLTQSEIDAVRREAAARLSKS